MEAPLIREARNECHWCGAIVAKKGRLSDGSDCKPPEFNGAIAAKEIPAGSMLVQKGMSVVSAVLSPYSVESS